MAPASVLLSSAPPGFDTPPIDPPLLGRPLADAGPSEIHVFSVADETGALLVQANDDQAAQRPAILLPVDAMFELRLDAALRFVRRLRGQRVKLIPTALRLTSLQRARLIHLLHAYDIHDAGGGPRDVAAEILASEQAHLPSIEWKDSHARRRANRLIHDAVVLVERGYLKLLRGA